MNINLISIAGIPSFNQIVLNTYIPPKPKWKEQKPSMETKNGAQVKRVYEDFEPYCKWYVDEERNILEVHLQGKVYHSFLTGPRLCVCLASVWERERPILQYIYKNSLFANVKQLLEFIFSIV